MSDTLLTKQETAGRLKVSTRTIDRLRATEVLPWVHVRRQVRFREADVNAFIERQVQGGMRA